MPSFVTRSGRVVKKNSEAQAKQDALEALSRLRRGEKVAFGIKEDEPLFDEVPEDEYKNSRKSGFIVGGDDDEDEDLLDDSDVDFIDDEEEKHEFIKKSSKRKSHKSNSDKNHLNKSNQPSVRSFLQNSSNQSKNSSLPGSSKFIKDEPKAPVDQDDVLSQMLFDIPSDKPSYPRKAVPSKPKVIPSKPNAFLSKPVTPIRPIDKKNIHEPTSKRQRRDSPIKLECPSPVGTCMDDDCFEDSLGELPSVTLELKKEVLDAKYHEASDDDNSQLNNNDDYGLTGVPLDDDLKSNLEFYETKDHGQYTRIYWYDCVEDQVKNPGSVYFFGRVFVKGAKRYVSCCTIVKNITKTCYLMINQDCTYEQAEFEFKNMIAKQYKIKNFQCQKVTKKYAFSDDSSVPLVADYVKIDYPANITSIPQSLSGETFTKVLNLNQSPMEKIILELKLRGPCWLRLMNPVAPSSQLTWSKIELVLESPSQLTVDDCEGDKLKAPYLCTFSLSLRTFPNPITHNNEIIAIAGMVNTCFNLDECLRRNNKASGHFCLMAKPPSGHKQLRLPFDFGQASKEYRKTKFEVFDNERDLIQAFMDRFMNLDPDIVVGHDLLNFDFETLVMRMRNLKMNIWSKLGRFRRSELPQTKAAFRYLFSGRIMCDIKMSAQELIKARSYDLTELSLQILDRKRIEYNHDTIIKAYSNGSSLIQMIHATWEDNDSIFSILVELNVIPLSLKITNITGNILSRTLAAGRSERNEYLLLHAFHEANFICPEKQLPNYGKFNSKKKNVADTTGATGDEAFNQPGRRKAAYTGGLVLEPKTGYYDNCILLMDFNSLYPSIIQEFNICFSTVKMPKIEEGSDPGSEIIADEPSENTPTGILPTQLKNLVDRRRAVKKLLIDSKSAGEKLMLDIEQKALKLTANSMYGCLGFEASRFYAKHLASLVTFKGRKILMSTKAMVEQLGFEVIYGDTDSLMINTKVNEFDEVLQKGNTIKNEINRSFKLLEIDIDGVYRPLLLLKKKNYAGTAIKRQADGSFVKEVETKGLDTVRRDRAIIAKEAGERVLDMILKSEQEIDEIVEQIHSYLKQLATCISAGELPLEKFLISKQLNKNPEQYQDTKGVGHVVLALRHNSNPKNTRKMKAGDTVEYLICLDGSDAVANQRAYTISEVAASEGKLTVDIEYYLCQQIHPVMVRICEKLPITNAYVLAEVLGVEKSTLLHIRRDDSDGATKKDQLISRGAARFHSCQALVIRCPNCGMPDTITQRSRKCQVKGSGKSSLSFSLSNCPECGIRYAMRSKHIVVQIMQLVKKLMSELYAVKLICDNPECAHQTRNVFGPLGSDAKPICELCEMTMSPEWDDRRMDLQLNYLRHLLNIDKCQLDKDEAVLEPSEDLVDMYRDCFKLIDYQLKHSFINNIDTNFVFSMVCSARQQI